MGLYNQLFGRNKHADEILGLIGLRPKDIERFSDCEIIGGDRKILVYARTGGRPDAALTGNPYYVSSEDDECDKTYAYYYFDIPGSVSDSMVSKIS